MAAAAGQALDAAKLVVLTQERGLGGRGEDLLHRLDRWNADRSPRAEAARKLADGNDAVNLPTKMPPALRIEARYEDAAKPLLDFLDQFDGRVLFTADSPGRRESVLDLLSGRGVGAGRVDGWQEFAEHKRYSPGDDIRNIDWNAYARLERFFIKLFVEEEDLTVHLLVDVSQLQHGIDHVGIEL